MRQYGFGAAALALLPGIVLWLRPQEPARVEAADSGFQFRLSVGWNDTDAKEWVGRVTVTGGELARVEGWRFSQEDSTANSGAFRFRTKIGNLENQLNPERPYGQTDWGDPAMRRLIPQGLVVRLHGGPNAAVKFESEAGTFEFRAGEARWGEPLARLDGNARIERMPLEDKLSESGWADDHPVLAVDPDGRRWVAWLAYQDGGDAVAVSDGRQVRRVTDKGDHHGPAIAVDGRGWLHVAWAERQGDEYHLYESVHVAERWTGASRLTQAGSSNIAPVMVSDGGGKLALVWQSLRAGQSVVMMRLNDGRGWGAEQQVSVGAGNAWVPAAGWGGGKLWVTWDAYSTGNYQVYVRPYDGAMPGLVERVSAGEVFAVRPSVAVTAAGVPVIAWEESDALWGKDFSFLSDRDGAPLYRNRRVRVAYRDSARWLELPSPVDSVAAEIRRYVQQPRLAFDPAGRLFLAFRVRTSVNNARMDYWASGGRWESYLTQLEGTRWRPAIVMPSSVGRNSMRVTLATTREGAHVAWPSDNRAFPGGRYGEVDVYAATLASNGEASLLRNGQPLRALPSSAGPHPNEEADLKRIRGYRLRVDGRTYRIVRGDLHRHTELSGDGAGDGQLEDLYRYALDAASLDYAHVGDHQMGQDESYNWWITQKSNDLYYMPARFVPLYGYERSVPYPNGHRNVVWAERGKPVLPIGAPERTGKVDTGSLLYPYLKETGGIATSHSSATPQGTDWRDNDPALEPIVELYQGYESSYEHEGAPRAWMEGQKAMHGGKREAGYVWNAWAKGYKLGVQASSDHVSTHTSYACILVEDLTRAALLDAMRRRHTYAATDNIVVDFRAATSGGTALMGDITKSATAPKLVVKLIGTVPIAQVDVIKNNTYVHKLAPKSREVSFEYVDAAFGDGESYYYVRAQQVDGEMAWSSPIWVTRQ